MKRLGCAFIILLIVSLLINGGAVSAMNKGFSTEAISENDIKTFVNNINLSILNTEPPKQAIECFAVGENGLIAIGCSNFQNKTICIYTDNGDFQYGYSFECSGNFGIDLNKDALDIYFVRSDVAISINSLGEIESISKIQNTLENNLYWNKFVFSSKKKVGDTEYILKNQMGILNIFTSNYAQLIAITSNGEETIIYDINSSQFLNTAIIFICVIAFVCFIATIIIFQFIKLKQHNG